LPQKAAVRSALHHAIAEVPAKGAEPGTVVNVVQSGYTIGDRLLRPAMVTVAKAESGNGAAAGEPGGRVGYQSVNSDRFGHCSWLRFA
jgi:hypothetical protein